MGNATPPGSRTDSGNRVSSQIRQPRQPRRASTARSRSGCLTCKQKHVKCDETRPRCRKCAEKGYVCGGYTGSLKWSYKHQPMGFVEEVQDQQDDESQQIGDGMADVFREDGVHLATGSVDIVGTQIASPLPITSSDSGFWLPDNSENLFMQERFPKSSYLSQRVHQPNVDPVRFLSTDLFNSIPRAPSMEDGSPDSVLNLISNWFEMVCPAWSGFDSQVNTNQKIASDLWHTSAAVFNSLQSMSASFLSARSPQMRRPALELLNTATMCIQGEVDAINKKDRLDSLPTGVLFSLFCLGTTLCWLDVGRTGAPFLLQAKRLLRRATNHLAISPSKKYREELAFFNKSAVYWEMIVSVVEEMDLGGNDESILRPSHQSEMPLSLADDLIHASGADALAHPWTGISELTSRLFTRSVNLCRRYRRRITKPTGRASSLKTAMKEIEEAQKVEEQLLQLDFSSIVQTSSMEAEDDGPIHTPRAHLAYTAEAYQLAALLQLYVTFPDLVSLRLPGEIDCMKDEDVPWDKWIIPLTLRLTKVLEQIPPDPGSRVVQPLLYICASIGLRVCPSQPYCPSPNFDSISLDALFDLINRLEARSGSVSWNKQPAKDMDQTQLVSEVLNARDFVRGRLSQLENTLQPKPIQVARELVHAIWAAYDEEGPGSTTVHWLDVMEKNNLRSLFG